jgi:hypothetical protein
MLAKQGNVHTMYLPFYEGLPSLRFRTVAGIRQRRQTRGACWVNWNGDYQDFSLLTPADIEIVSHFDLQLVVAYDNVEDYEQRGVRTRYWQIGWEPNPWRPGGAWC